MPERVDRAVLEPDLSSRDRKLLLQWIPDLADEDGQDFAVPELSLFGAVEQEAVQMARESPQDVFEFGGERHNPASLSFCRADRARFLFAAAEPVVNDMNRLGGEVDVFPSQGDQFTNPHPGTGQRHQNGTNPSPGHGCLAVFQHPLDLGKCVTVSVRSLGLGELEMEPEFRIEKMFANEPLHDGDEQHQLEVKRPRCVVVLLQPAAVVFRLLLVEILPGPDSGVLAEGDVLVFDGLVFLIGIAADTAESGWTVAVFQKLFPAFFDRDGFFVLCWNRCCWHLDQPGFSGLGTIEFPKVLEHLVFLPGKQAVFAKVFVFSASVRIKAPAALKNLPGEVLTLDRFARLLLAHVDDS